MQNALSSPRPICSRGFSLLEMMIVITIIMILANIATPFYQTLIRRARETVLRDDLFTMRVQIDEFTKDNPRAPATLDELLEKGYLGAVPRDPMTGASDTWAVVQETAAIAVGDSTPLGITVVHSGSDRISLDGRAYSSW